METSNHGLKEGMLDRILQYFVKYIATDMLGVISNKHSAAVDKYGKHWIIKGYINDRSWLRTSAGISSTVFTSCRCCKNGIQIGIKVMKGRC